MTATAESIPFENRNADLPDLLGQAYHVACSEAFEALQDANVAYFNGLAPTIVRLGSRAMHRTLNVLRDGNWMLGCGQIAADMIDLSGYAMIYSELLGTDLWSAMREAWNERNDVNPQFVASTAALAYHAETLPAITNRGILRVNWEQRLEERLKNERLIRRSEYYPNYLFDPPVKVRRNETVRAFCHNGRIHGSPFAVFVTKFALRANAHFDTSSYRSVREYCKTLEKIKLTAASIEEREIKRRNHLLRRRTAI